VSTSGSGDLKLVTWNIERGAKFDQIAAAPVVAVQPGAATVAPLSERGFVSVPGAGAPTSILHQHPIDWVFTKGVVAATNAQVKPIAHVSDHQPILATLNR
jgi:endonuclease/exonuclease/phosphatase family metal-dependent hydrolase